MMFHHRRRRRSIARQQANEPTQAEGLDSRKAFVYEMIHFRHLDQESMLWDAPTLSLTAQAFLLTIALGSDSSDFARLVA